MWLRGFQQTLNLRGTLFRFKQALAPGQRRWYTYPATHSQKKLYAKQGFQNVRYDESQRIGENTITKIMKEARHRCNFECTGHGLRSVDITTAVNKPGLNQKECLAFSCHSSVAAQKNYIRRNPKSEMAKFGAFRLLRKSDNGKKGDTTAKKSD